MNVLLPLALEREMGAFPRYRSSKIESINTNIIYLSKRFKLFEISIKPSYIRTINSKLSRK